MKKRIKGMVAVKKKKYCGTKERKKESKLEEEIMP